MSLCDNNGWVLVSTHSEGGIGYPQVDKFRVLSDSSLYTILVVRSSYRFSIAETLQSLDCSSLTVTILST